MATKRFLVPIEVDKVTGLSLPVNDSDATNKEYVDQVVGNVGYSVTISASNLEEVIRIPASTFKSNIIVIDIDYIHGLSCSFQVFAKVFNSGVDHVITHKLGDTTDELSLELDIQGSDFVLTAINNDMVNSVTVEARILN